ncbi:hypothetical protein EDD15DRAFT_2200781 [Pisolithus albus]|nr:hypothetical protein EDD15DRAFT_2200781 [Pisolithus albus]
MDLQCKSITVHVLNHNSSDDIFLLQGSNQQVWYDHSANENPLQPGDHVARGPLKFGGYQFFFLFPMMEWAILPTIRSLVHSLPYGVILAPSSLMVRDILGVFLLVVLHIQAWFPNCSLYQPMA